MKNINLKNFKLLIKQLFSFTKRINTRISQYYWFNKYRPQRNEIIKVEPDLICGHISRNILKEEFLLKTGFQECIIVNGDWDIKVKRFNFKEHIVYKSCYMRWIEGKNWRNTPVYFSYIDKISSGRPSKNARTVEDLDIRYENLDRIFEDVKKKQQMSINIKHLITISVARDGSLFWGPDGRHRIAIALLAGLQYMPAKIGFIHPQAIDHFQSLRIKF